ncbi:flagellar biosynthesis protein FlhB [Buchnera aphidicola (Pemphigus obesinymphae)]|uniref:flagellar biosynthesis protein FlhB n=1 Tax=Buchnera aphidicola TaxID=9 RepID=UPI0022376D35|nr:flagellar biosynthesis protein FlhB [Buchnera aphidicola]MCW5196481.1 flagellar biosynthesis protein FlhB [Buchnera aphidicola (Pemphigus obesinymphae)]
MNEEKTEKPTDYRFKKVRQEGKIRYSYELNSLIILSFGGFFLFLYKDIIFAHIFEILFSHFKFNHFIINDNNFIDYGNGEIFFDVFYFLFIIFIPIFFVIFFAKLFGGVNFNLRLIKCDLKKLNPLKGFKTIFSFHIFFLSFKIILKLFLVIGVMIFYLSKHVEDILSLVNATPKIALITGFNFLISCFFLSVASLIPVVIFDIFWQNYIYQKQFKMSRKEIKDELKQTEGDPYIKWKMRQAMKMLANHRMISDIPKADVIVINPIHYSIALLYDEKTMYAPKVIAKGAGDLACKIRKIGKKHHVPIIAVPVLARALYFHSKLGQYIPGILYKVVAEVLAWVWQVKIWEKEGGIFPKKPENLHVPPELTDLKEDFTGD